jgi:UDP-N-acetylmuramate: L-alanyl-gamma-D-glutamyl-meso-diaminopimelate ligase
MHIHILGIGGVFMAGVAKLAQELGHFVSGSDNKLYPPMSTVLASLNVRVRPYSDLSVFEAKPDQVVIGNSITRGNPSIEHILKNDFELVSGPQWIKSNVLRNRHVIAVAGTHGKTTVSSLVSWLLEKTGLNPGFLIGGLAENFNCSARLGTTKYFVIEADEYDTSFFDKRSKFVHYQPDTLVINNLEYDHADIFADLDAVRNQFHQLLRTMSERSSVIIPAASPEIDLVIDKGCWSKITTFGNTKTADWTYEWQNGPEQHVEIFNRSGIKIKNQTTLAGLHNAANATAAVLAAVDVGVDPRDAIQGLADFLNVKRRLELKGEIRGRRIYDDFAHHPTAIMATLKGLRSTTNDSESIIALLEIRSNTMKMGVHRKELVASLKNADLVGILLPKACDWDVKSELSELHTAVFFTEVQDMARWATENATVGDHILTMSNGSFGNIHDFLFEQSSKPE